MKRVLLIAVLIVILALLIVLDPAAYRSIQTSETASSLATSTPLDLIELVLKLTAHNQLAKPTQVINLPLPPPPTYSPPLALSSSAPPITPYPSSTTPSTSTPVFSGGGSSGPPPPPPPPTTSPTSTPPTSTSTPVLNINGTVSSLLAADTSWQIIWNDNKYGSLESGVWQVKYPAGFVGGSAPATLYRPLPNSQNVFVSLDWKANADWQGHKSNVNKLEFLLFDGNADAGQGGDLYLAVYGTPGGPYDLRVNLQFRNGDTRSWLTSNVGSGQITFGNWYHIDWQVTPNTSTTTPNGVIKWWLDGALVGDYEDILFPVERLIEYKLSPTWGGVEDVKTKDDYFWFNNLVLR